MKSCKPLGRLGVVAAVLAAIAAALVGGASTGRAATSFTITLDPLIGTAGVNSRSRKSRTAERSATTSSSPTRVTARRNTSSVVVTSDLATFSDSDNASCAANPKDAHQMVCTPFGGTFDAGRDLRRAPALHRARERGPGLDVRVHHRRREDRRRTEQQRDDARDDPAPC